jgi:hypothetical protein
MQVLVPEDVRAHVARRPRTLRLHRLGKYVFSEAGGEEEEQEKEGVRDGWGQIKSDECGGGWKR